MFLSRVITLGLVSATLSGVPLPAFAGQWVTGPYLVRNAPAYGPEVVFSNRYAGLVGYTVPRACGEMGGLIYSDHFIRSQRRQRVWKTGIATCPAPLEY